MQSLHLGWHYTCAAMVDCLCCIYYLIGHIPAFYRASDTGGHSHFPLIVRRIVIPVIIFATQWWNPSGTFSMDPVTTQISLPYNNTNCKTDLYITPPHAHTVAPVFIITLRTIYQRCRAWRRFWYRASQDLLLYATVQKKYGSAAAVSRGSYFTPMWLQCKLLYQTSM